MELTENQIERTIRTFERKASAFESIALSLQGIHGLLYRAVNRFAPEPKPFREAIVTRIPNEEDRAKEAQGASNEPIRNWYSDLGPEEIEELGPRERQFIQERIAKARDKQGPGAGGPEASRSEP